MSITYINPLQLQAYNPGPTSMMASTSTLVMGEKEAILFDVQFTVSEAKNVLNMVKNSGKTLKAIYISQGDPDFYFGTEVFKKAFPNVPIIATPATVTRVQQTYEQKLKVWGPKLGADAPTSVIIPEALKSNYLTLEGKRLEIIGSSTSTPERTYVWIPSIKTLAGGVLVFADVHLFMADSQTEGELAQWQADLDHMLALKPELVIPGHYTAEQTPVSVSSITFTSDYIKGFVAANASTSTSQQLVDAMNKRYPNLQLESNLTLSAQVFKGDISWP